MKTHKKLRKKYKCPNCEKTFFDIPNLRKHALQYHPDLPQESLSEESLEWKPVEKKFDINLPTCMQCRRSFPKRYNLQQHIKSHHRKQRSMVKCVCGVAFTCQANMMRHIHKKKCNQFQNEAEKKVMEEVKNHPKPRAMQGTKENVKRVKRQPIKYASAGDGNSSNRCSRANYWICNGCGAKNFVSKSSCFKCNNECNADEGNSKDAPADGGDSWNKYGNKSKNNDHDSDVSEFQKKSRDNSVSNPMSTALQKISSEKRPNAPTPSQSINQRNSESYAKTCATVVSAIPPVNHLSEKSSANEENYQTSEEISSEILQPTEIQNSFQTFDRLCTTINDLFGCESETLQTENETNAEQFAGFSEADMSVSRGNLSTVAVTLGKKNLPFDYRSIKRKPDEGNGIGMDIDDNNKQVVILLLFSC